jgi:hypothetical protein
MRTCEAAREHAASSYSALQATVKALEATRLSVLLAAARGFDT